MVYLVLSQAVTEGASASTVLEAHFGDVHQRYHTWSSHGYGTGYQRYLMCKDIEQICLLVGMHNNLGEFGGTTITLRDIVAWLGNPAYSTYLNWRTWYQQCRIAVRALQHVKDQFPLEHNEVLLLQVLTRWFESGTPLTPPSRLPLTGEHTWDALAVEVKYQRVRDLITAARQKPTISQVSQCPPE